MAFTAAETSGAKAIPQFRDVEEPASGFADVELHDSAGNSDRLADHKCSRPLPLPLPHRPFA